MKRYPIVFSIGGSDCTGGAGVQADTKTVSALGAYAASAITSITVQNALGMKSIHTVPADIVRNQIEAVMEDMWPDVVKIGLVNNVETARVIADCLRKYHPKYVVFDPVMLSFADERILDDETIKVIKKELFPYTNLVTINLFEAEVLTGLTITSKDDLRDAARFLAEKQRIPVLAKGANLLGGNTYDVLYIPDGEKWEFTGPKVELINLHGGSCTFSAAIATYLALEELLPEAVRKAREFLQHAIEEGKDVNLGPRKGPVCHSWNPVKMQVYGTN